MSEILDKIRKKLKEEKIIYSIDGGNLVLQMGTFNGGIQLETPIGEEVDSEEEYDSAQTWVMRDGDDADNSYNDQYHDPITLDNIEEIIDELIDTVKEINSGVGKVMKKIAEAVQLSKSYEIHYDVLYDLMISSIDDYDE